MHFSKTYTQLLESLPPELRDNAIQYRQVRLKKIINRIVGELSLLGLEPKLLQELIEASNSPSTSPTSEDGNDPEAHVSTDTTSPSQSPSRSSLVPKVVYELTGTPQHLEPQLRIWLNVTPPPPSTSHIDEITDADHDSIEEQSKGDDDTAEQRTGYERLLCTLRQRGVQLQETGAATGQTTDSDPALQGSGNTTQSSIPEPHTQTQEIVIPLVHDSEFFNILSTTLESVSNHLTTVHEEFTVTLKQLSHTIADSAHPASVSSSSFQPLSPVTMHAGAVRVRTTNLKSDLYAWRQIFQLYLESEVFEDITEAHRGERSVEECERRLQLFADRVTKEGLGDGSKFKLKQSAQALETFLSLNLFILNLKKLSHANSEATRKILKKHAKRTALSLPNTSLAPSASSTTSLPRILVQALGEKLIPIIPSLADYCCHICMDIAFKPIRLGCGHLFCVRCLVKMQKRGQDDCPMCRQPTVVMANRSNVDWALLNFMQDWFPIEARDKLKANEKEAANEELAEMGINPDAACIIA
ncbi:hypothetical protein CVT24_002361 [Panaeolus cyanescens]|uniref:RING-type domain-containing protein n=1 Tax=Panaeolus cyanescens TaxID=181874 RepID=A0A409W107_9AGAR|nr:hypothetical protein CVT24_002361 [Panaeolus cyanescens]